MQKEQTMRVSDLEIELMKNTFAENDALLKGVRKTFLGLEMPKEISSMVEYTMTESKPLQALMRRMFLPEIEGDVPLGQNIDLWLTLSILEKTPEEADLMLRAREELIDRVENGLQRLLKPKKTDDSKFKRTGDPETDWVNLTARNIYLSHIENVLLQIKQLSGRKEESIEETKARLQRDSSK